MLKSLFAIILGILGFAYVQAQVIVPFQAIRVQHANGSWTTYAATTSSDVGRGTALLTAMSSSVTGDSLYLASTTFDIQGTQLDLSGGGTKCVNVFGSGMYNTFIKGSRSNTAQVKMCSPGLIKDLGIKTTGGSGIAVGYDTVTGDASAATTTLMNVYLNGIFDCANIRDNTGVPYHRFFNVRCEGNFDGFAWSTNNLGVLDVYDSDISLSFTSHVLMRGIVENSAGNIFVYNSSITVNSNGNSGYGVEQLGNGNIYLMTGTTTGDTSDIYNNGTGNIYINSSFGYNPTTVVNNATGNIFAADNSRLTYANGNASLGTNGFVLQTNGLNSSWVSTSSLNIASGGGGVSGGTAGMLAAFTSPSALTATSGPTFGYYTATSTTATSTQSGPLLFATSSALTQEGVGATSTNMTIDWGKGNQQLLRMGAAAVTVTQSDYSPGNYVRLIVCNPNGTAGAITFTGIDWQGGVQPTQTVTANVCDAYIFFETNATSTPKIFGTQAPNFL